MMCEEMIKEIYYVAGVLEGLSCCLHRHVPEAVATQVSDCVDRLGLVGAELLKNCDPVLEVKGMCLEEQIKLMNQKKVSFGERPTEAFGRVYPPKDATDQ